MKSTQQANLNYGIQTDKQNIHPYGKLCKLDESTGDQIKGVPVEPLIVGLTVWNQWKEIFFIKKTEFQIAIRTVPIPCKVFLSQNSSW